MYTGIKQSSKWIVTDGGVRLLAVWAQVYIKQKSNARMITVGL